VSAEFKICNPTLNVTNAELSCGQSVPQPCAPGADFAKGGVA